MMNVGPFYRATLADSGVVDTLIDNRLNRQGLSFDPKGPAQCEAFFGRSKL
jgi:hypothetical protein